MPNIPFIQEEKIKQNLKISFKLLATVSKNTGNPVEKQGLDNASNKRLC